MSFVSVDALEREFRRLEAHSTTVEQPTIPAYPVEFAMSVGIEPDPWQVEVLASDHSRKILCCGRQTGKTTVSGLLAAHKALTQPGSVVLIVAPAEKQAKWLRTCTWPPEVVLCEARSEVELLRNGDRVRAGL